MVYRYIIVIMVIGLLLVGAGLLLLDKPEKEIVTFGEIDSESVDMQTEKMKVSKVIDRGLQWDLIEEDGIKRKSIGFSAINYEYNDEFIPVEDYLSFYVQDDIMYLETLDGDSCSIEIEYELINPNLTAENVYNIVQRRGGYYFTTEVTEDVEKIKYKLDCNNLDIGFENEMLMLGEFGIDFSMARELQNITAIFNSVSNEIEFEILPNKTGSLNLIDPTVEYNYNTSNAGVVSYAIQSNSCDDPYPPLNTLPPDNDCQFFDITYSSIADDDGSRQSTNIFTSDDESYQWFNVTISEDLDTVNSIKWTHDGLVSFTDSSFWLLIWNYSSSSWLEVASESTSTIDVTQTYETSSFVDFISNNVTHFMVFAHTDSGVTTRTLQTDYVKLDVILNNNLSLDITNPSTEVPKSVNSFDNITITFDLNNYDEDVLLANSVINNITIGGVQAIIDSDLVVGDTINIRTDDIVAGDGNDAVVFTSNMPNTSYSALTNGLTDSDDMYAGTFLSKLTTGVTFDWEDDTGGAEAGNFMWLVMGYGAFSLDGNKIVCDTATSSPITFSSAFNDSNYAWVCSSEDDADSPLCSGTSTKNRTDTSYKVEDDTGADEPVSSIDFCAFTYGEYSSGNLNIKAGSSTQSSGSFTATFGENMTDTTYVVIITNREDGTDDGCACEVTARNINSFTAVCEDDGSSPTNCESESFEWVVVDDINEDVELTSGSTGRWENATHQFVNVTVPDFATGKKDLYLNMSVGTDDINFTESLCIDYGGVDTCTCPGLNNDWEIDLSDDCVLSDNCDLGTGDLTFVGVGSFSCDAVLTANSIGNLSVGSNGWLNNSCEVNEG